MLGLKHQDLRQLALSQVNGHLNALPPCYDEEDLVQTALLEWERKGRKTYDPSKGKESTFFLVCARNAWRKLIAAERRRFMGRILSLNYSVESECEGKRVELWETIEVHEKRDICRDGFRAEKPLSKEAEIFLDVAMHPPNELTKAYGQKRYRRTSTATIIARYLKMSPAELRQVRNELFSALPGRA